MFIKPRSVHQENLRTRGNPKLYGWTKIRVLERKRMHVINASHDLRLRKYHGKTETFDHRS